MFNLLPPYDLPCDPIDAFNIRFVNSTSLLIVHPLNKYIKIELYKERWFRNKPESYPPKFDYSKIPLASSIHEMSRLPPVTELYDNNTLYFTQPENCSLLFLNQHYLLYPKPFVLSQIYCYSLSIHQKVLRELVLYLITVDLDITAPLELKREKNRYVSC